MARYGRDDIELHPALRRLTARLSAIPSVDEVWLFGSRARGDARRTSDIDLAVLAPRTPLREWLEVCDLVDDADTLLPIDLVRLGRAPAGLAEAVRRDGIRIHGT